MSSIDKTEVSVCFSPSQTRENRKQTMICGCLSWSGSNWLREQICAYARPSVTSPPTPSLLLKHLALLSSPLAQPMRFFYRSSTHREGEVRVQENQCNQHLFFSHGVTMTLFDVFADAEHELLPCPLTSLLQTGAVGQTVSQSVSQCWFCFSLSAVTPSRCSVSVFTNQPIYTSRVHLAQLGVDSVESQTL